MVKHRGHGCDTANVTSAVGDPDAARVTDRTVGDWGTVTSMVWAPPSEAWAMIAATSSYLAVRSLSVPSRTIRPELRARDDRPVGGHGDRDHLGGEGRGQGPGDGEPGPADGATVPPTGAGGTGPAVEVTVSTGRPGARG